jgi:RNA polymerase sigma-70 factor, ECF subfamily
VPVTARDEDDFFGVLTAQLPALRRYGTALTGNAAEADDLVQDCIERALKQAGQLQEFKRMGGWLRSILHNLYIDDVRRKRRQGVTLELTDAEHHTAMVLPSRDYAAEIDLERAMATLSFEHRQILLLIGLEGLNYREVADELSVPIGTVMSRLARAREKLRHAMGHGAMGHGVQPS